MVFRTTTGESSKLGPKSSSDDHQTELGKWAPTGANSWKAVKSNLPICCTPTDSCWLLSSTMLLLSINMAQQDYTSETSSTR
eukprot:scaffold91680_cov98-Cyclotella_meneghiniana.AAC.5